MTQISSRIHAEAAGGQITDAADLLAEAIRSPQCVQVRRRILRQLLQSLIFEGVLSVCEDRAGQVVDGLSESGEPVRYRFVSRPRYGFGRVSLGEDPVLRESGGVSREVTSLSRFLIEIGPQLGAESDRIVGFARELEETHIKDTVAQYIRVLRGDVLAGADYDELESTVMDGHPYHPSYKSRLGFDIVDHLSWGPEFAADIHPLWLAARRTISDVTVSDRHTEADFLRSQLGSTYDSFRETVRHTGSDPDEFTFLPVHPWQWRKQIAHTYADAVAAGDLIVLGTDLHAHHAQQSIRTLACRDAPERAYLKLSLSMVNTSTSRVLAPHTVVNAPRISDWLREIVASDAYLRDEFRVILLGEVMGTSVELVPVHEAVRGETYGTLACIWRESLHTHLDAEESGIPFTALTAREVDGTPMIDSWIRGIGIHEWVRMLLEVGVLPLVHLLQRHGIGVEAHAQNMVLVHMDGRPTRVALRDFHDGVRFSRTDLSEPSVAPVLAETPAHHVNRNSFVETDRLDQVTDFMLDAFFFINIGELAMFLDDAYDLDEPEFWAMVRETIAAYHRRFPDFAERYARFDIAGQKLDVEQLTARRLLPDTDPRMHSVPNPLCAQSVRDDQLNRHRDGNQEVG